jgi:osmotically-inducible protein OsmY
MKRWLWAALVALACGCANQDMDCLERLCGKAAGRVEAAVGGPNGRFADGWHAVNGALSDAALDSRVALRLRWDRTLADADVTVELTGPGAVRLTGTVDDDSRRLRAGKIAEDTQGVEQVSNEVGVK